MTAEGMVARWAPVIPGYVHKHYGHLRERHCLYETEDLIQIAMIELMKLSRTWEPRIGLDSRNDRNRVFFHELKWRVASAIREHRKHIEPGGLLADSFDKTFGDGSDSVLDYRTSTRQATDSATWHVIHAQIVDYFSLIPMNRKVIAALRNFDELSYKQIGELLGRSTAGVITDAARLRSAVRDYARNQFTDHAVREHQFQPAAFEPTTALVAYVQGRHRVDVDEWMGYFTLSLRTDPVYLNRMLGPSYQYVEGSTATRPRTELQQLIDARIAAGQSLPSIAAELEVPYKTVWNYSKRASGHGQSGQRDPIRASG